MTNQAKTDVSDAGVNHIKLVADFINFNDEEVECAFYFRKPTPQEMVRANKEAQKDGERAFRNLTLTLVRDADRDAYRETIREYPGVAVSFASDIYQRMGYGSLGK